MPRTRSGSELNGTIVRGRPYVRLEAPFGDTGFSGGLALPRLPGQLREIATVTVELADGQIVSCRRASVRLVWLGELRVIDALELGSGPIIGMELLSGTTLSLERNRVRITR